MAEFGDVFRVVTLIPMHAYEHKSTKIPMHGALSVWLRVWFRANSQIWQFIMWGQCLVMGGNTLKVMQQHHKWAKTLTYNAHSNVKHWNAFSSNPT